MKKLLFGVCTCLILMIAACTPNSADDETYEQGIHKQDIKSIHKQDIKSIHKGDIKS